jgi:hypothetical protein
LLNDWSRLDLAAVGQLLDTVGRQAIVFRPLAAGHLGNAFHRFTAVDYRTKHPGRQEHSQQEDGCKKAQQHVINPEKMETQ